MPYVSPPDPDPEKFPDKASQMLGGLLRKLREAKGVSISAAARHIGASNSKISRMESGINRAKRDDLRQLLTLYGVIDPRDRQAILEFNDALNRKQWWDADKRFLGRWFRSYLFLESVSESIRTYEARFVPGLLQTEEYAEAVIRRGYTNEAEIQRRVWVRMRRQEAVLDRSGTKLWALLDIDALSDRLTGPGVMRRQIEFLIGAARRPNVIIQVLPRDAGWNLGFETPFSVLRLRVENMSDVVYFEHIEDAIFIEDAGRIDPYLSAMSRLGMVACEPEVTVTRLEEALERLGPGWAR